MRPVTQRGKKDSRVVVVVLTYNGEFFVEKCLSSLRSAREGGESFDLLVVDNGSSDATCQLVRTRFPEAQLFENSRNLGFAGGNNVGIRRALEEGADFVYLLNQDAQVRSGFLGEALKVAKAHPRAASVQSLLLLSSDPGRVNSAGNALHFLGLGYCDRLGASVESVPAAPFEIAYASGAAVLLRAEALREVGLFDEELFLYHEDLDLGWRLRLAGWTSLLAPRSRVLHDYSFARNKEKLFLMERNRWKVLLKCLRLRNLLVLAPFLAAGEVAMLAIAARNGWLGEKLRAEAALLDPKALAQLFEARKGIRRTAPDSEIARWMRSEIEFEGVTTPFVRRVANPLMAISWRLARRFVS